MKKIQQLSDLWFLLCSVPMIEMVRNGDLCKIPGQQIIFATLEFAHPRDNNPVPKLICAIFRINYKICYPFFAFGSSKKDQKG